MTVDHKPHRIVLFIFLLSVIGSGMFLLNDQGHAGDGTQMAQAPQAMPVNIQHVKEETVQIWQQFSGRMEAVDTAEVRPRVTGAITEVRFTDGQIVKKGDILFVIDPRPYEATLSQAKAQLQAADTEKAFAERELRRAEGLIKSSTISQSTFDQRKNALRVAEANVAAAKATVQQAQIDRNYAYVKAPISGRVGRAEITLGNLVTASDAPLLTSVVSDAGIYAAFNVDERTYLDNIRKYARTSADESTIPVRLLAQDGTETHAGFIEAFDNQIDTTSGTIRARAYFANEDQSLVPGMFAEIEMAFPDNQTQILVDERAIGTNQNRKFVYVVSEQGTVAQREVSLGTVIGQRRVITNGLKAGDRVIVEGIMRLRPGMPVSPIEPETAS